MDTVDTAIRNAKSLVDHCRVVHWEDVHRSRSLLAADRVLELLEGELEGGIALQAMLDRGDAVDHRRVIALEELAEMRERHVQQTAAEVHCDLTRQGDVPAPPA